MAVRFILAFLAFVFVLPQASQVIAKPKRIISLDYCADQFVLGLANRDQIVGVSVEATDSHSYYRDRAVGIKQVRASSDLILALKPDLVIRTWAGGPHLSVLLDRLKIPVLNINYVEGLKASDGSEAIMQASFLKIKRVAQAIGQARRGEIIIEDLQARYTALKSLPPLEQQAIYLTPGAYSTGAGTSMDSLINLAGLQNYMSNLGYKGWAPIPLEHLVSKKPDLFITGFYDSKSATQHHWGVHNHKFARDMLASTRRIDVPGSYLACDGLFVVDAAETIREQFERKSEAQ